MSRPVILCILDGVGLGAGDEGDAVAAAHTPNLDRLMAQHPWCRLKAHGTAVGLPSDEDMGNSEVGHNALGAGRVFAQGATLVEAALRGPAFSGETWRWLCGGGTLHLLGMLSDGNVHSHISHVEALIRRAAQDGVKRLRLHILTDGRDVSPRSALGFIERIEAALAAGGRDYRIASGGGRMHITMDRYEADWPMVKRGWDCHVNGLGRPFPSAAEAVRALYAEDEKVDDQWLPAFVITEDGAPIGRIQDGDAVLLFNFRGDRAIEISRAFEGKAPIELGSRPAVRYAGMMEYDGDTHLPARYLVTPPAISDTVGENLARAGKRSFVVSETQKYGHVTYFYNGNRSGYVAPAQERYVEIPSDNLPFDQAPAMKAREVTAAAVAALQEGGWDLIRLNLANGDMVGHTGNFAATVQAVEVVDECVGRLAAAAEAAGAVLIVTADHGNADDMIQRDKKGKLLFKDGVPVPKTSHSLNPVPCILVDARGQWTLKAPEGAGLANLGATVLTLCGVAPPESYLPGLLSS